MASEAGKPSRDTWHIVATLVAADGSETHPALAALLAPGSAARDLADAVHSLCALHGRLPGLIDHALYANRSPAVAAWLQQAANGFGIERGYLARLTSVVGPVPSTPGQAESEAAVLAQRHALDMLAQSGRVGCALGAAAALILDWRAIRDLLDAAARRCGVEPPAPMLPEEALTALSVLALAETPGVERAIGFGAQQLLAQHRGLWSLLEARAAARGHH